MRIRAISAVSNKELKEAKALLDSCYAVNTLDTMVIALLHETLLMHINKQNSPSLNLNVIKSWESQYPFLGHDHRIQEIKIRDAVLLGVKAFDEKKFKQATGFTDYISKILKSSIYKSKLLQLPNLDALYYNIGMQLFYDKKFVASHSLFSQGLAFYPKDKDMNTMYKLSKERIQNEK